MYAAFNRGDFEGALEFAHPDIELIRVGGFPPVKGREAMLAWMRPDAILNQHAEPHEFIVNGDRVLARLTVGGTGAGSGVEMSIPMWQLWTFEDGQVVRTEGFFDEAEARKAAGLDP